MSKMKIITGAIRARYGGPDFRGKVLAAWAFARR